MFPEDEMSSEDEARGKFRHMGESLEICSRDGANGPQGEKCSESRTSSSLGILEFGHGTL